MNQHDQNDTQSTIVRLLECISERHEMAIEKEWDVTKCSRDGYGREIYAPRVDIAIGPFNIDLNPYDLCKINCEYRRYNELFLQNIISKGSVIDNEGGIICNKNPRCTVAIEIANHSEI